MFPLQSFSFFCRFLLLSVIRMRERLNNSLDAGCAILTLPDSWFQVRNTQVSDSDVDESCHHYRVVAILTFFFMYIVVKDG